ncbi:hypothetical protein RBH26_20740 [Natronolimnohabitans sp. A-GB9]|uniref:HEPN domain-containing protein n=1 Tax=Natronolimnohabitans sp. A-GB9 TaxID=3069757 RepID=UPI0027B808E3|nr:HEPN domain-containing protein [Natronolimnohabitans sp. A-GB9]MDQ2052873.1 hypothetical protein [Natronolimnohabitans sp. A-GB9]
MPETFVFEFLNLYIPEDEVYDSDEFPIRIEAIEGVEEFEDNRRENGSEYGTGYWRTALCFIEANEERAQELAEWLTYVYSFFQMRDVRWEAYYPEDSPQEARYVNTYRMPIDNTKMRFVRAIHESGVFYSKNIGRLVDVALTTIDEADERLETDLRTNISLFMHAEGTQLMIPKFLLLWLVLEANADRNYHRYMKSQREYLFDDDEKEQVREYILEEFEDEFSEGQLNRLNYNLDKDFLFEPSTLVKIKKYAEQIELGFNSDEVEEIVKEAREIRNEIVHSANSAGLRENTNLFVALRKMVMFLILRELGVEPEWHAKLVTPNVLGPDSEHEWGS